jgi:hypothetical protein
VWCCIILNPWESIHIPCQTHICTQIAIVLLEWEYEFISNLNPILIMWCCYNPYRSVCYTPCWSITIEPCPQISIIYTQSNAYLVFGSHVLNYSNCKYANWVLQAFLRPSLVPKCDLCYSKNKCCYTYSNSILVALFHTYVIHFTWANLKLFHTLIRLKDFINYIMPNLNLSQIILISPN